MATAAAATPALTASACSDGGSTACSSADKPFGLACSSSIPKDGEGSCNIMARDPVATAVSSNSPALSTVVSAVQVTGVADTPPLP